MNHLNSENAQTSAPPAKTSPISGIQPERISELSANSRVEPNQEGHSTMETKPAHIIKLILSDLFLNSKVKNFGFGQKKDIGRELIDTVVFVLVVVLLLKNFVAEAYVIPTGSMAETLWGDQIRFRCDQCGWDVLMSASEDRSGFDNRNRRQNEDSHSYCCENCGYIGQTNDRQKNWSIGDKVLVSKDAYHHRDPNRFEVIVFKYPEEPFNRRENGTMNYIKRLVGLGGETLGIYGGDLYVNRKIDYSDPEKYRKPKSKNDLWKIEYTYKDDAEAIDSFNRGEFDLIRKSPAEILAVKTIVFDLDHAPKQASEKTVRWQPSLNNGDGWEIKNKGFTHSGPFGWIKYHHYAPGWEQPNELTPSFVDDFVGYNRRDTDHWVRDLLLQCQIMPKQADAEIVLEIVRYDESYRAKFKNQICQLSLISEENGRPKETILAEAKVEISNTEPSKVWFANFDSRLTLWVNGLVINFGKPVDLKPSVKRIETVDERLTCPIRIGVQGDVQFSHVSIWRDIYYLVNTNGSQLRIDHQSSRSEHSLPVDPTTELTTMYVHPNHLLCMGDNSAFSLDSRSWGTVPERLLLGKAVLVYWPYYRFGLIK